MHSPFDLNNPHQKIESKIVVALERISEAFRVLLWKESKERSLTPIQTQILIFLLFHPEEMCKVSYLAQEFNMTKPTISDSVRILLKKKLIQKLDDPTDHRSYTIDLTPEGKETAREAASFAGAIEAPLSKLSDVQKEAMLSGLLRLIYDLNRAGIITIQRMCLTCRFYEQRSGGHYCRLLQTTLANAQLRVDCPEHELKYEDDLSKHR